MIHPRQIVRSLIRTPMISAVAVVSLALGIGATAAIFSVFEQMVLRTLPVEEPARLVNLSSPGPKQGSVSAGNAGSPEAVFSYPMFRDLEEAQDVLTGLAGHVSFGANLGFEGTTLSGQGILVSGSYFEVLSLRPEHGRLFTPDDDRDLGAHPVVVLSHAYWRSRFNADPGVIGETLRVNGQPMTLIGVAPKGFRGTTMGDIPEVFVPISMRAHVNPGWEGFEDRRSYWVYLFGRLRPEQTLATARAALEGPYRSILQEIEAPLQSFSGDRMERFKAKPLLLESGPRGQSTFSAEVSGPLLLLLGVTCIVLLIAAANVANLLLTKASRRSSEIAVRLSLGAPRRALVAQLMGESFLLSVCGGALGLLFARATMGLIVSILPSGADAILRFELSPVTWIFLVGLSLVTGLAGLYPALHSTRQDLATSLKDLRLSASPAARRFRGAMVTLQIALSMMLLVAAGLFTKSLLNVSRIDLGIDVEQLATFALAPELNGYSKADSRAFFERVEREVASLPGVRGISASMVPLIAGSSWASNVSVEGFENGPDVNSNARFNEVGSGFFETVGIRLLTGRELEPRDDLGAPKVAVVNQSFARKFGLTPQAVGRRMAIGGTDELDIEIVGVVEDAKYNDVKEAVPPQYFLAYRQSEDHGAMNFYVRAAGGDPEQLLATLRKVVSQVDPNLPIADLRTMETQVRENVALDRILTTLSAAFAILATLLAAVGLYGVLAYAIAQRTREIGLRMALGADTRGVLHMVLRELSWLTLPGALVGLLAALGLGRAGRSMLYELESHDPRVLVGAVVLMLVVALTAGMLPALRAVKVSPMEALRDD